MLRGVSVEACTRPRRKVTDGEWGDFPLHPRRLVLVERGKRGSEGYFLNANTGRAVYTADGEGRGLFTFYPGGGFSAFPFLFLLNGRMYGLTFSMILGMWVERRKKRTTVANR